MRDLYVPRNSYANDNKINTSPATGRHSLNMTPLDSQCSSAVSLDSLSIEGEENELKEKSGMCLRCGKQLYKTKKKGIFKTKEVKVPLNIPGEVERGQCLQCGKATQTNGSGTSSPTSSLVEDLPIYATRSPDTRNEGKATYQGSFNVYGERDGQGTMSWDNGDVYTGDFFNGNRHGNGTLKFKDGSEYVGEWECNLQHGIGTRRWNNGDCYSGQYQNGKRTGEGRFYFSNGDMYTGQWVDGIMEGWGRYYYASGQRFEGTFHAGKRRGKGKLQRLDGSLDIGVYDNDIRTGLGVRWSADRTMAWKMLDGLVKKKITIPEAVALDYDIEAAVRALDNHTMV